MKVLRHKYRFATRAQAEEAERDRSLEMRRNYFAALAYMPGAIAKPQTIERGAYQADVITHHAMTGNELAAGAIVVMRERVSTGWACPTIRDAYEWSTEIIGNPREYLSHAPGLVDLAYAVRQVAA